MLKQKEAQEGKPQCFGQGNITSHTYKGKDKKRDQIILGECLCNQEITYVKCKTKPEKAKLKK